METALRGWNQRCYIYRRILTAKNICLILWPPRGRAALQLQLPSTDGAASIRAERAASAATELPKFLDRCVCSWVGASDVGKVSVQRSPFSGPQIAFPVEIQTCACKLNCGSHAAAAKATGPLQACCQYRWCFHSRYRAHDCSIFCTQK